MASPQSPFQIFLSSPDLPLPSRSLTLTLTPDLTLHRLKLSLFPSQTPPQTLASLYFTLNGKPLLDSSTLSSAGLTPSSLLTLRLRLAGGGGDGGATGAESRDCYLNMYAVKKPDKVDPNETRISRWTTCALSAEPLAPPCVIDRIGNIFNKESLLEALLHKRIPKEFGHIRGMKDMIPVHLAPIVDSGGGEAKFQCPISGLEFNGKYGFVAVRVCGHVLSAKALKEVKSSACLVCHEEFSELEFNGKYGFVAVRVCGHVLSVKALKEVKSSACLVCHEEFSELDRIVINGSAEEVGVLRERMEEERGRLREKKEKRVGCSLSGTKHGIDEKARSLENGVKDIGVKRFKAVDIAPVNATKEVYASIFTSSKKMGLKETYSCRSLPLGRN